MGLTGVGVGVGEGERARPAACGDTGVEFEFEFEFESNRRAAAETRPPRMDGDMQSPPLRGESGEFENSVLRSESWSTTAASWFLGLL